MSAAKADRVPSRFVQNVHKLADMGYAPVPIKDGKKHPIIPGWNKIDFAAYVREKPRATFSDCNGLGVMTETTPAIDIDCMDQGVVVHMQQFCAELLDAVPIARTGMPPRVLMLCQTDDPFPCLYSNKYDGGVDDQGKSITHQLEILGTNHQCVVDAIHIKTGEPYSWGADEAGAVASPYEVRRDELPRLSREQAVQIIAEFHRVAQGKGWPVLVKQKAQKPPQDARGVIAAGLGGDPVLDWLDQKGLVLGNHDREWVTVVCPQHDQHSDPDDVAAYYAPLGRGDAEYVGLRGFSCKHTHGSQYRTADFLAWVTEQGGPDFRAPAAGAVEELLRDWVFAKNSDRCLQVSTGMELAVSAFQHTFAQDVPGTKCALHKLWMKHPRRVVVFDRVTDPTTSNRFVEVPGTDEVYLNDYRPPDIAPLPVGSVGDDDEHVARFVDFIEYLIPDPTERKYVMCWLATKIRRPGFRGNALLMVAPNQGMGRGTLAGILGALLGAGKHASIDFSAVDSPFNPYLLRLLTVFNEVKMEGGRAAAQYERLKVIIEPTEGSVEINEKNRGQRIVVCHMSTMMFTQHENALSHLSGDRRFFVVHNTGFPRSADYFLALREWLDAGLWVAPLYRWFCDYPLGDWNGYAPAPMTATKLAMIRGNESEIDCAVRLVLSCWGDLSVEQKAVDCAAALIEQVHVHRSLPFNWHMTLKRELRTARARLFHGSHRMRVDDKQIRYLARHGSNAPFGEDEN